MDPEWSDPELLRAVVPEPLEPIGDTVNYEFIRMPDSTGFGDYTETGQVIPVRFTTKDGALYAIELGWPKDGEAVIHALASGVGTREVASVALLGSATPLTFQQQPDGLHIRIPADPAGQYAYAYRITWR